jgi:hypothetical protein
MPSPKTKAVKIDQINRMLPAARDAQLGAVIGDLVDQLNNVIADNVATRAKLATLLAKLDADAGVTDVNYASTQTPAAATATAVTDLALR